MKVIVTLFFILVASTAIAAETGVASVYDGGMTASGETALPSGLTAAHRSLPFGTIVRVTNLANGRSVVVRINDRGPYREGRIINLMPAAGRSLGIDGLATVTVEPLSGHNITDPCCIESTPYLSPRCRVAIGFAVIDGNEMRGIPCDAPLAR